MEATAAEFSLEQQNPVLKTFLSTNTELLDSLVADGRTAQDVYDSAVEYFGENSKTTPPSMFFPVFVRFIKAYKQAEQDNEQKRKLVLNWETPSTPSKPDVMENKVSTLTRLPQMDLIAELKRRQVSPLVREGKDGAIEDIITALKSVPFTARRSSFRSTRRERLLLRSGPPSCCVIRAKLGGPEASCLPRSSSQHPLQAVEGNSIAVV
ncbi:unnamed protein product [Pleuronectes platessa]|uniref:FH2 domain-containing protein n=1 Tax=Pleuronectes platessa TaxID=8262 RepID=A0A9N7ZCV3_PLEPL|nr:unnamed protein product [Pleuronectes platessa]